MSDGDKVHDQLDRWVNTLAQPLLPPQVFTADNGDVRLQFSQQVPEAVMVGKLVRAVSALHAANALAGSGFITECAVLIRVSSDLCSEVHSIGLAIDESNRTGSDLAASARRFVEQYFTPKPTTLAEFEAMTKVQYVSRAALLAIAGDRAKAIGLDPDRMKKTRGFLNYNYDAYVHGSHETTMELFDARANGFLMRGHPSLSVRQAFKEAVASKMVEIVSAVEITAAVTSNKVVFEESRAARRGLDELRVASQS